MTQLIKLAHRKNLYGTFQLNGSLALHSWYKYLAGYSAQFVIDSLENYNIKPNDRVLDYFGGVGTTSVACKKNNIESIGIELNPFACFVAQTKLNWEVDLDKAIICLNDLNKVTGNYKKIKLAKNNALKKFFLPNNQNMPFFTFNHNFCSFLNFFI